MKFPVETIRTFRRSRVGPRPVCLRKREKSLSIYDYADLRQCALAQYHQIPRLSIPRRARRI